MEYTDAEVKQTTEGLRKLTVQKLVFHKNELKAQTYRDWLELLTMQLEAVGRQAADYWQAVCREVEDHYAIYLAASPTQKPGLVLKSTAATQLQGVERAVRPVVMQ